MSRCCRGVHVDNVMNFLSVVPMLILSRRSSYICCCYATIADWNIPCKRCSSTSAFRYGLWRNISVESTSLHAYVYGRVAVLSGNGCDRDSGTCHEVFFIRNSSKVREIILFASHVWFAFLSWFSKRTHRKSSHRNPDKKAISTNVKIRTKKQIIHVMRKE